MRIVHCGGKRPQRHQDQLHVLPVRRAVVEPVALLQLIAPARAVQRRDGDAGQAQRIHVPQDRPARHLKVLRHLPGRDAPALQKIDGLRQQPIGFHHILLNFRKNQFSPIAASRQVITATEIRIDTLPTNEASAAFPLSFSVKAGDIADPGANATIASTWRISSGKGSTK